MANPVTLLRVFLAAPGDIQEELAVVFDAINDWNDLHGPAHSAILKLVRWKTDCAPAAGDRPQAIINQQALDSSHILVGIFWSRFGNPTGVAESGTEEEIRRSIAAERRVMLYFSERPIPDDRIEMVQQGKIHRFKREFKTKALYWTYAETETFRELFRRHLALAVQDILRRLRSDAVGPASPLSLHFTVTNSGIVANQVLNPVVTVKMPRKRSKQMAYPEGTIGADVSRRNYVRYLTKQYNEFREADANFGSYQPFHFSVIHKNIESEFGSPTHHLPVQLFESVAEYVQGRIDNTILGRNNRRKGVPNFKWFDEFLSEQASKA